MGTYYELKVDIILKPIEEIGEDVHKLLRLLFQDEELSGAVQITDRPKEFFPDHPFWKLEKFYLIGYGHYDSSDNVAMPVYTHPLLRIDCDINRGYEVIEYFLDWLAPYVEAVPEPGDYIVEGSWQWGVERTEVEFGYTLDRRPCFALIDYQERSGGFWGSTTEVKVDWVKRQSV